MTSLSIGAAGDVTSGQDCRAKEHRDQERGERIGRAVGWGTDSRHLHLRTP